MHLYKSDLRAMLPNVGDVLTKSKHMHKSLGLTRAKPRPCVVIYVNRANYWYKVRFDDGAVECYKVPELPEPKRGGWYDR